MIQSTELRIGNLVNQKGSFLTERVTLELLCRKDVILEAIPLTEEWLLKLGFDNFGKRWMEKNLPLDIIKANGFYMANVVNEIKYVHQLQNLYFALTEEELKIN